MKKILLILLIQVTTLTAHASLWCSFSSGDRTPTETARGMAMPYEVLQIDNMRDGIVQVDLTDNYNNLKNIFKTVFVYKQNVAVTTINGVFLGDYEGTNEELINTSNFSHEPSNDISIKLNSEGKILLKIGKSRITYHCEIPGNYQESYSIDE